MKLTVVGLGLIGGSLSLALKKLQFVQTTIGVDENKVHANEALTLKLVDDIQPLELACSDADIIVLAVPVQVIKKILPQVLSVMRENAIVMDVGSTKEHIVNSVKNHPRRKRFVAAHPMAGTEFSGPKAAFDTLFNQKVAVICNPFDSNKDAVETVEKLLKCLDMRIVYMDAKDHDLHAAYVSHLSHISSFILAETVLDKEKDETAIFNLASGGFESTVRLAKSSAEMWTPIFEQNKNNILTALKAYIERLEKFYDQVEQSKFIEISETMNYANKITKVLNQIQRK